jgi:cytochrome c oxidase subunit 2
MIRKAALGLLGLIVAGTANAEWGLNMPKGVTELSKETYGLHMMVFWWCVAIGVVVFGAMIYSLVKHRKSQGAKPADFSHSTLAEVVWTVIPVVILLIMAVPAAKTMLKAEDSRDPDISIVITGYQWKWHYKYQDEGIEFFSSLARPSVDARRLGSGTDVNTVENYLLEVDRPVVVPVGAKVRLLMTSNDVIHSWWVPDLSIKKDAVPGIINETWFRAEEVASSVAKTTATCRSSSRSSSRTPTRRGSTLAKAATRSSPALSKE